MSDLHGFRFYIETFGCQMNENDSERIAGRLAAAGALPADKVEASDLVIVNTCAVRAKSEEKLFSYLGRLKAMKKKSGLKIGVTGCIAQIYREKILERNPDVDFILGPDNYHLLPELVDRASGPGNVRTAWSADWREEERRPVLRRSPVSAYVTIMEGCDNFCAYCVVPFARGREKFRPMKAVLDEVRSLAGAGYREVQFLGQNVNTYRDPESGAIFRDLLREADGIEGIAWIRFITSHPKNFGPDIAEAMARSRHICRALHLPLQSGSTSVLERMKRGYTREEYLDKVRVLRSLMPGIALSTDIIVGYPGETESEFADTLRALDEIRFDNIFSFRYSPRPGTAAARLSDDVPFDVKRRRLIEVQALQKSIQTRIHQAYVGRTILVLGQGPSRKDGLVFSGRSEGHYVVNFRSDTDVVGRFVRVRVTSCGPYSLRGEVDRSGPDSVG